jgi:hypothetical protein
VKIEKKKATTAVAGTSRPIPALMLLFIIEYRVNSKKNLRFILRKLPRKGLKSKDLYPYHPINYLQ